MSVTTDVAARVLAALGEAFARRSGETLDQLVDGLAAPMDDADARLRTTDRGWAAAFDLDQTPDPAWLGRAIGSPVPQGLAPEDARDYVRGRAYWQRGTPASIRAAVGNLLTGDRHVTLIERDGSPWQLRVRVYEPEVPVGVTVEQIAAAAATQKPVGIVLEAEIRPTASFAHFADEHGPTFADAAATFATFSDTRFHIPEEGTTP